MNKSELKAARKLLHETIHFYNRENRAFQNTCQYKTPNGKKCAIGRILTDECLEKVLSIGIGDLNYAGLAETIQIEFISPYKNLSRNSDELIRFLGQLQELHDGASHWNQNGLTWNSGDREVMNSFTEWFSEEELQYMIDNPPQ